MDEGISITSASALDVCMVLPSFSTFPLSPFSKHLYITEMINTWVLDLPFHVLLLLTGHSLVKLNKM